MKIIADQLLTRHFAASARNRVFVGLRSPLLFSLNSARWCCPSRQRDSANKCISSSSSLDILTYLGSYVDICNLKCLRWTLNERTSLSAKNAAFLVFPACMQLWTYLRSRAQISSTEVYTVCVECWMNQFFLCQHQMSFDYRIFDILQHSKPIQKLNFFTILNFCLCCS